MEGRDEAGRVVSGRRMRSRWVRKGQAGQRQRQQRHHLRAAAATGEIATTRGTGTLEMEKTHTDGSVQFARRHWTGLGLLSG